MRLTGILLVLCLIWPLSTVAQQATIDQLRNQYTSAGNDTVRLSTARRLFGQYVYSKVDSAIYFAEAVVEIGEKLKSQQDVLAGNNYLGIAYSIKGDFNKSAEYMKETLRLHTEAGDSINMAYSFNNLGVNYTYAGDYLQAAENLLASARIKEALERSGTPASDLDMASTMLNIGLAYQSQLDTAQARSYFNRAVAEADRVGDCTNAAKAKIELANMLTEEDEFQRAIVLLEESEAVLKENNDLFSLGKLYNNLSLAYAGLENGRLVSQYATKAIEVNQQIGNERSEALGRVYLALGHIKLKRYTLAIRESNIALAYGEANEANDIKLGALKNLSEAYAAQGNYKQAYEYSLQYKDVDELIFAAERSEQIERLSAQYEAEKRLIEIENLNQKTDLQALQIDNADSERRFLMVLIGSLVIILLLIGWFYKRILESRKTLQAKNEELDLLNSTKDRFFAIISHDLRSYINAFRGNGKLMKHLLKKQETAKLEQVSAEIDKNATNLSELLDNLLHWSMDQLQGYEPKPEAISLSPVIDELLASYAPLAEAKGISLKSEVSEDTSLMADRNGLSVILRNLVANAIKFTEAGAVFISTMLKGTEQIIAVKDSGVGIPEEMKARLFAISEEKIRRGTRNEKGTGLGLNLAYEFAKANGGRLEVESVEGEGTTFLIYLPHG